MAVVLQKLGFEYLLLERDQIGSSFKQWPKESRFISPSFTGNFFKMPDLNAITPETSPALNLMTQHPTGQEYSDYLNIVAKFYELSIQTGVDVRSVKDNGQSFSLDTSDGEYMCKYLIWAGGEFQYPRRDSFAGAEHCVHFADVESFAGLEGDERIVIGGYESGFDASLNMIKAGKKAILIDDFNYLEFSKSDSSYCLSPYTRDRINQTEGSLTYFRDLRVESVERTEEGYAVKTSDGNTFKSPYQPINCTGFESSISMVDDLFEDKGGYPLLSEVDESTKSKNLFLVGPQVKHDNALFCFVYKFRQRFAVVGEEIARREGVEPEVIQAMVDNHVNSNFYLKDLSCCDGECSC